MDSALFYYRKTYLICKAEDFLPGQNLSLNNMGSTAVLLGLTDSAEVWLNESISVKRELGSPDFSQEWKNMAILYSEKNDYEMARSNDTLPNQPIPDRASLVRDDGKFELFEIKADKQPIGKHAGERPFTTHAIQLNEGDSLYIFSDGYPDQFGGEKGKKYKSGKFKKFILSIVQKPHAEQRQLLLDEFETWRGDIEQIDDVCVIGVRV